MGLLDGKVAIITGAGAGIGRGIALAFASEGATLAVAGRTGSTLDAVCAEIASRGAGALPVVCDVRELNDVERLINRTIGEFGQLDILVNNAQTYRHSSLLDATEDDYETTFASGPLAVFRAMRLAHPHLKATKGVVVNFGSGVQIDPSESFHGVYFAAKNAIEAFTRVAAVEWGGDGIRTMLIMPAAESPQLQAFKARDPERFDSMLRRIPLGRFGDAEADIGRTITWLVSENARFMTGCTFMLDGGQMYLR